MPRDGSGNYTYPPGTPGIPDTTIESAKYNGYIADIQQDLNLPRPIVAGGTGANSATAARANLSAEVRGVQVTNYDTQVWESGSFWSAPAATSAPNSVGAFAGTAIVYGNDQQNIALTARNVQGTSVPPVNYVRCKAAGVWGTWAVEGAAEYVNVTGDMMTGRLDITYASPVLALNKSASLQDNRIIGTTAGVPRWAIVLGDTTAEAGANTGSNFGIFLANDAGTLVGPAPFSINRASGTSTFNYAVTCGTNALTCGPITASGAINCGTNTLTCGNISSSGSHITPINVVLPTTALSSAYTASVNIGYKGTASFPAISMRPAAEPSNAIVFQNVADANVGAITCSSTTTGYVTSSSRELKEDLKSFDAGNIVDATNVYDFAWKSTKERAYGVIAQQAIDVYPTAVTHDEERDWWGVDYSKYVPVLLQEVKALRARVAELEEARLEIKPP